jgi:ribonuclease BN (tRNA processing enzyme)
MPLTANGSVTGIQNKRMRKGKSLRLTILGNSATYPGPGKACSGYLLTEGDTRLLLDCGTGVLASLQKHIAIEELTAIIISHMHSDHFFDLVPLRYALTYGGLRTRAPLPVYFPAGGRKIWERVVAAFDELEGDFSAPFEVSEYREGKTYLVGSFSVGCSQLRHYIPNYGIEVRSHSARMVYSGDTGPCPELVSLAHQADLFLCESTFLNGDSKVPPGERKHLTAGEAATAAQDASVRRLVLTHLMPGVDAVKVLETARQVFGKKVSLAEEGRSYPLR